MEEQTVNALRKLGRNINRLTRQEARTIREQILSGNIEDGMRTLTACIQRREEATAEAKKDG